MRLELMVWFAAAASATALPGGCTCTRHRCTCTRRHRITRRVHCTSFRVLNC